MTLVEARRQIREVSRVTDFSIADADLPAYIDRGLNTLAKDVGGFFYEETVDVDVDPLIEAPFVLDLTTTVRFMTVNRADWGNDALMGINFFDLRPFQNPGNPAYFSQHGDHLRIAPVRPELTGKVHLKGFAWRYYPTPFGDAVDLLDLPVPTDLEDAAISLIASLLCDTNDDFERATFQMRRYSESVSGYVRQRANENAKISFANRVDWRRRRYVPGEVSL